MVLSYVGAGSQPSSGPTPGIEKWKAYVLGRWPGGIDLGTWGIRNIPAETPCRCTPWAGRGIGATPTRVPAGSSRGGDGVHDRASRAPRHPGHPRLRRLPHLAVEPQRLGTGVEAAEVGQRHG